jgi:hypothetical protein
LPELRPEWTILVEDLDPYRHLVRLVGERQDPGDLRLIDTGLGDTPAFVEALERADYVVVPVRRPTSSGGA